ncbi:PAS domain S-box protein, partial [Mariprofundus sp. EBB-1]
MKLTLNAYITSIHPKDRNKFNGYIDGLCSGVEDDELCVRCEAKHDSYQYVLIRGKAIFEDEQAIGIIASVESLMARSNHLEDLEIALEAAGLDFWENNLLTGEVVRTATRFYIDELGYHESDVVSSKEDFYSIVHPDDVAKLRSAISHHMAGETKDAGCEFRIKSKAGEWVWYYSFGKILDDGYGERGERFLGVTYNIHERKSKESELYHINEKITEQNTLLEEANVHLKEKESALRESQQILKFALDGAGEGVWDHYFQTGTNIVSSRLMEMFGLKTQVGKDRYEFNDWSEYLHPDSIDSTMLAYESMANNRSKFYNVEQQLRSIDGSYKWFLTRGMVVEYDDAGNPLRATGTSVDITKRKRMEELNACSAEILEMVAEGKPSKQIYETICLLHEKMNPGMHATILALRGNQLHHVCAPNLPEAYLKAIDGVIIGPSVGSCGTAAFTREEVIVEDIASDPLWGDYKELILKHGLVTCWSEPVIGQDGNVIGTFAMYFDKPTKPNDYQLNEIRNASKLVAITMNRENRES